jgi:hypothetical protein
MTRRKGVWQYAAPEEGCFSAARLRMQARRCAAVQLRGEENKHPLLGLHDDMLEEFDGQENAKVYRFIRF